MLCCMRGEGVLPCHTGRLSCSKNIWPLEPSFVPVTRKLYAAMYTAENCHTSYLKAKEYWGGRLPNGEDFGFMIDMTTKLYTTIELLDRKSQNIEFQLYFLILSHTPISYYNTYAIPMMKSGNIFFILLILLPN